MSDAADDVALGLLSVEPTSLAGARALLRYFAEADDGGMIFPERVTFVGDNKRSFSFGQALARHVANALEEDEEEGMEA
jgi:hypothetical protein